MRVCSRIKTMKEGSMNLMVAVARGMERDLDGDSYDDLLILQSACYILNTWGYSPKIDYDLFIGGPFSSELMDWFKDAKKVGCDKGTDVSQADVSNLKTILGKGLRYLEAYATLLAFRNVNPGIASAKVLECALSLKPNLSEEIREAFKSLTA